MKTANWGFDVRELDAKVRPQDALVVARNNIDTLQKGLAQINQKTGKPLYDEPKYTPDELRRLYDLATVAILKDATDVESGWKVALAQTRLAAENDAKVVEDSFTAAADGITAPGDETALDTLAGRLRSWLAGLVEGLAIKGDKLAMVKVEGEIGRHVGQQRHAFDNLGERCQPAQVARHLDHHALQPQAEPQRGQQVLAGVLQRA